MSTEARVTTLELAMAELAVAQARTQVNLDRFWEEGRASAERSEREFAEFRREMVESRREFAEFRRETVESRREFAEFRRETVEFRRETARETAELRRQQGELSNKFGTLVEDIVFPGIPEVFRRIFGQEKRPECALRVTRRHVRDPRRMQEFDATAEGDGIFLINETKSRVRAEDVSAFALLLSETVSFFPHAEGKRIVGALASFHIDPSVVRAGEREGLLMLGLSSGLMAILNSPDFIPKAF